MTDIDEALPVLPRELPSLAVEVRSIAAPPTPQIPIRTRFASQIPMTTPN
jgi:hypothetical protein